MSSPRPGASRPHVAVIGSGFCGLAAAWELGRRGVRATVLERDAEIGGLAGSFIAGGARLKKFYHHWFTSDVHVMKLIAELGHSGGRGGHARERRALAVAGRGSGRVHTRTPAADVSRPDGRPGSRRPCLARATRSPSWSAATVG